MTKRSGQPPAAKTHNFQAALTHFRRTVYSAKNIRGGLARARRGLRADYIPAVVADLMKDRMLFGHVSVNPFPADFDRFTNHLRLAGTDPDREFLWTAAVLRTYSPQLSQFASLREKYERSFIAGDMELAGQALDQIRREFGVSLWYLENKLQFVQLTEGLSAQKAVFEAAISHRDIDIFAGLLGYYFSIRSEDNYSFNEIATEASHLLDGNGLGDYTQFHVLPYDLTKIGDPAGVVAWEECRPIIDKYLAFVSMAKLQVARHGTNGLPNLAKAIKLLEQVEDHALNGLRRALGIGKPIPSGECSSSLKHFDAYTEGSYEACLASTEPSIELSARASATTGLELAGISTEGSIAKEIVSCMAQVLLVGPTYSAARARLKKLCITCPRHAISTEIVAFLERTHDNTVDDTEYTESTLQNSSSRCEAPGHEH